MRSFVLIVLWYHGTHYVPVAIAGCYDVMITIIVDKVLGIGIVMFLCGFSLLLAPDSADLEEKRSTEQPRHVPLNHAQLISNDTTLHVSGAYQVVAQ